MRAIAPWLLVLAVLPRVDDPWPETIGLGFLASAAGAGALLAGLALAFADARRREKAMLWGTIVGFVFGAALYLISLAAQVISHL